MDANSGRHRVAEDGCNLSTVANSPHLQTLAFLETVDKQLSVKAVMDLPKEPRVAIINNTVPDGNILEDVAKGLLQLDRVDMQSAKLGTGYNHAYYALGQAYRRAIRVGTKQIYGFTL